MKRINTSIGSIHEYRRIILAGTLATAAVVTAACSSTPAQKVEAARASQPVVKSAPLQVATSNSAQPKVVTAIDKTELKQPTSKLLRYKSRDYGVSFEYPWQYSFASAKKVNQDEALQPKSDGHDGQITLARIDLPKGFYPDTDFESGYFTLSLNPDLEEQDCKATLDAEKHGGLKVAKINDTDFFWVESAEGGKGATSTVRNYVAFTNDVCYEFEVGVKTRNEDGLAREVNADQVMRKLDGMLKSVKIGDFDAKPAALQSSIEQPKTDGQK